MISVIIPVYNGARYIDEALRSAQEALVDIPHEIIVVNDGSTDALGEVLGPWMDRIVYIQQENQGAGVARNTGLARSTGEHVAFMDADDIWAKDRIRVLLTAFTKHPELDIAIGRLQRFYVQQDSDNKVFFSEHALVPSFGSSLIRKDAFTKVGVIEPSYRFHEDVDWFFRVVEHGLTIAHVPHIVSYYRIHDRNATRALHPSDGSLLQVLAASLRRRGAKKIGSLRDVGI